MIRCEVPDDVRRFQTKSLMGLPLKKMLVLAAGAVVAAPMAMLTNTITKDMTISIVIFIIFMVPFLIVGFYGKYNLNAIQIGLMYIDTYIKNPPYRVYKSELLRSVVTDFDVPQGLDKNEDKSKKVRKNNSDVLYYE